MARGISNLLALLIVITIVIGVAIAVSGIGAHILMSFSPKGNDVVLTGFTWKWFNRGDGSFTIYVRGIATNIGRMPVNITDVWLAYGGKEYYLMFKKLRLEPNEYSEISGKVVVDELPKVSPITVFVKWCTAEKCSISFTGARIESDIYLLREEYYTVTVTIAIPSPDVTATVTITQPATTTTVTATQTATVTQTVTTTTTATATVTTTTTTTATITRPSWLVDWLACYDISDNIYVAGYLQKPVDEKEPIPYIVKFYDCTIFGCNLLAVKPFEWVSKSSFEAKYYLPNPKPLHSYKIEIWSVDWTTGKFIDLIYEQTIDMSVRCA